MAQKARKVNYFAMSVKNRPGKAVEVLETLRSARINLLGFSGFPRGKLGQLDLIPEDSAAFSAVARRAKLPVRKKKTGFVIQGDDRPGAIASVMERLARLRINVTAVEAVCAGKGRFGALLWVKEKDVRKAAKALGAA
ncbi:MAG: hypothetical protein ACYDDO_10175 [Acidiferrobacterales bacterium]